MNKKSQLYIFTAIILIVIAFGIAQSRIPKEAPKLSLFDQLYSNFATEAPIMINEALQQQQNVTLAFVEYAQAFKSYAKTRDPQFGFSYVLFTDDEILIQNFLGRSLIAQYDQAYTLQDSIPLILPKKKDQIRFTIDGASYDFQSILHVASVSGVFISEKGNDINVQVLRP